MVPEDLVPFHEQFKYITAGDFCYGLRKVNTLNCPNTGDNIQFHLVNRGKTNKHFFYYYNLININTFYFTGNVSYQFLDRLIKMMPASEVAPIISNCQRFAAYVMQKMEFTVRRLCIGQQGCSPQYNDENINVDMMQPYACPRALNDGSNGNTFLSSMCLSIRYFCFNGI